MRNFLRIAALAIALGALGFWAARGANTGWTKNHVAQKTLDEVTGIEAVSYEERFVPGVEILGAAELGAGALFGLSFLFRKQNKQT